MLTIVIALAILWLTLMPKPLPDVDYSWFNFEGADKVVHAIMFATLTFFLSIDMWRYKPISRAVVSSAVISVIYGAVIEGLQQSMHLGRTGDWADLFADALGVIFAGLLAWFLLKN